MKWINSLVILSLMCIQCGSPPRRLPSYEKAKQLCKDHAVGLGGDLEGRFEECMRSKGWTPELTLS